MLMPSILGESLFDDFFDFPVFPDFQKMNRQMEKELYGRHAKDLMKVDIKENESDYEMVIDLPGFQKDEISAQLKNGYLTVTAAKELDSENQTQENQKYIRRERYAGSCQRSFYIGSELKQEDIKAAFEQGILTLHIPKAAPRLEKEENHYIAIEG